MEDIFPRDPIALNFVLALFPVAGVAIQKHFLSWLADIDTNRIVIIRNLKAGCQ
jgi:NDP-sugar pyrophosphorylase family protein